MRNIKYQIQVHWALELFVLNVGIPSYTIQDLNSCIRQKTKITNVLTLFFGAPKSLQMVTAARKLKDAYSLEEKLWPTQTAHSKADITLPTKVRLVKAMVFPVVMYGCESWNVKKAEH